jgi:hypothetical protein
MMSARACSTSVRAAAILLDKQVVLDHLLELVVVGQLEAGHGRLGRHWGPLALLPDLVDRLERIGDVTLNIRVLDLKGFYALRANQTGYGQNVR